MKIHTFIILSKQVACFQIDKGDRLIEVADRQRWVSKKELNDLIKKEVHFIDLTYFQEGNKIRKSTSLDYKYPEKLTQAGNVNKVFNQINKKRMEDFLTKFSNIKDRYYASKNSNVGLKMISEKLLPYVKGNSFRFKNANKNQIKFTLKEIQHKKWQQKSLIARIEGCNEKIKSKTIVLGAHLDSLNHLERPDGRAPGADDDGSGITVLLETIYTILDSNTCPDYSVEFHFYSAEEMGIEGSQDIVYRYYSKSDNVIGMLNLDMVGKIKKDLNDKTEIKIVSHNSNKNLDEFVSLLIKSYAKLVPGVLNMEGIDSDHTSWKKIGVPSACITEEEFNYDMHSPADTVDKINFDYLERMAKVAIGFAFELKTN